MTEPVKYWNGILRHVGIRHHASCTNRHRATWKPMAVDLVMIYSSDIWHLAQPPNHSLRIIRACMHWNYYIDAISSNWGNSLCLSVSPQRFLPKRSNFSFSAPDGRVWPKDEEGETSESHQSDGQVSNGRSSLHRSLWSVWSKSHQQIQVGRASCAQKQKSCCWNFRVHSSIGVHAVANQIKVRTRTK